MKKQSLLFLVIAVVSLVALITLRLILGGWENYLFVPLVFFIASGGAAVWTGRKIFVEFLNVKTTKEGLSMGAMIALTLVLISAINYLAAKKTKTFDFSSAQVNSLSDQTLSILKNLKEDLQVLYFYQEGTEGVEENKKAFISLVKKYSDESPLVKLQFVEVNKNPRLAQEYNVTKGSGVVFVAYQGRKNRIEKIDEQELTGALVKVTRDKDKKVYFTVGHGERDLEEGKEPEGLLSLKKLLEGNRFIVESLSLMSGADVPVDSDILVIAGPQREFLENEIQVIERYLQRGGSLLVALEPKLDAGLGPLLYKLGVRVGTEYVAQVMETPIGKAVNPQSTPAAAFSTEHAVTKPFGRNDFILMRLPAIINKEKTIEGLELTELSRTDKDSMAFPDTTFKGAAKPGPHVVVANLKGVFPGTTGGGEQNKPMNLLLVSDVDWMANQLLYKALNRDLALNSFSFLANEEQMISISPKEVAVTQMTITPNQFYLFIFGFIIPVPLVLIGASGYLWYRRRYA
jgi:ABC-type uncharacterized transport system involved in gliding motility auxiliary subunit